MQLTLVVIGVILGLRHLSLTDVLMDKKMQSFK